MKNKIIETESFNDILNGEQVFLKLLHNKNGTAVAITNYGARVVSWKFQNINIVVGFDSLNGYLTSSEHFYGATIGRFANRIARGSFTLDGNEYILETNNPPNHLHGGPNGFHTKVWKLKSQTENNIVLTYFSKDGEEGYPGNLNVEISYALTDAEELIINYRSETDKDTVINFTNHSFFNLNGGGSILNHSLEIKAEAITPVDESLIPTGEIMMVADTPFDFRKPKIIGKQINEEHQQIIFGNGYDHNFVLNKRTPENLAARVIGDQSGIILDVFTDQPGMQFYSGNFMAGKTLMNDGMTDNYRTTFCLETQHFPDSPNQENFPSTTLRPGQLFSSQTIYKLSMQS